MRWYQTDGIHIGQSTWVNVGHIALIIDTHPQVNARQWSSWRNGRAPEVIDIAPPRIQHKVGQAKAKGATLVIIDTPPHADSAARHAVEIATLVLIPCRPNAFDLAAILTTVSLIQLFDKQSFVVVTPALPNAPKIYQDTIDLVRGPHRGVPPTFCPTGPSIVTPALSSFRSRIRVDR